MRHRFPEIDHDARRRVCDVEARVPCGGGYHRVIYRADTGQIALPDHPRLSRRDEWELATACGDLQHRVDLDKNGLPTARYGPPAGCFALLQAWRTRFPSLPNWVPASLHMARADRRELHRLRDDARMRQGLSMEAAAHLKYGRARSWLDAWMRNPGDRLARTAVHRMIRHVQTVAESCDYERATEHAVFVIVLTGGRPNIQGAHERPQGRNGRETSARVRSTVTARVLPSWMRDVGRHPWATVRSSGHRCLVVHSWLHGGARYAIFGRPSAGFRIFQTVARIEERDGVWIDAGAATMNTAGVIDESLRVPWSPFVRRMAVAADQLFPAAYRGEPTPEARLSWIDYSDLEERIAAQMTPEERAKLLD